MATPNKPEKKTTVAKNDVRENDDLPDDASSKKKPFDDEDDDLDASYDDIDYDQLQDFDEDDDF